MPFSHSHPHPSWCLIQQVTVHAPYVEVHSLSFRVIPTHYYYCYYYSKRCSSDFVTYYCWRYIVRETRKSLYGVNVSDILCMWGDREAQSRIYALSFCYFQICKCRDCKYVILLTHYWGEICYHESHACRVRPTYTHSSIVRTPCIHSHIHAYLHSYSHTCIHIVIHALIHSYIHSYIHTYKHACIHEYIHKYIHSSTYVYVPYQAAVFRRKDRLQHLKSPSWRPPAMLF